MNSVQSSATDWTHQLIVISSDHDTDPTSTYPTYNGRIIAAENALIEALAAYATELRLVTWDTELEKRTPEILENIQRDCTPVPEEDRLWDPVYGSEYILQLAGSSGRSFPFLHAEENNSDWRLYDIKQILLLNGDDWLYHSTPDEIHWRKINIDAIQDTGIALEEISTAISQIPGAYLYARTQSVSWTTDNQTYEIYPDGHTIYLAVISSGKTQAFELERLSATTIDIKNATATLSWADLKGASRIFATLKRNASPPENINFPDSETAARVQTTLQELSQVYDFTLHSE